MHGFSLLLGSVAVVSADYAVLDRSGYFSQDHSALQFLKANLRVRRKNSGFFEETMPDSFERECKVEMCSREELREIFPNKEKTVEEKWNDFTMKCYLDKCDAAERSLVHGFENKINNLFTPKIPRVNATVL